MLFAFDYHDNRVHIDDTHSNQEYFCPCCGGQLIVRKGEQRQHHFAHKSHQCKDSWVTDNTYSISEWHNEWQNKFPRNNQEIKLTLGNTVHRADVLVNRTVIEFQHSSMSHHSFDDRNNFYTNLGYKVVWLFDVVNLVENEQLTYETNCKGLKWKWANPKKAFNSYDINTGNIDLYFQISFGEEQSIVKIEEVSEGGYEEFYSSTFYSKSDFLSQMGVENGKCQLPSLCFVDQNEEYLRFIKNYNISLNSQQERAMVSIDGSNLLLAVPGSGKTTVLVDRIGYMILVKKINPESILAITFNTDAVDEIKSRLIKKFGKDVCKKVEIRTINSLSNDIYKKCCEIKGKKVRNLIQKDQHRDLIKSIYRKYHEDHYPSEIEVQDMIGAFGVVKNMCETDEIKDMYQSEDCAFPFMFDEYKKSLSLRELMDFDDQMVFALAALNKVPELLKNYRARYKYICVDEAQDTSLIQHEIIKLLAKGNNLFMVGDEDQSIYGFRGAYPKAFLNFRCDYKNPYILKLETNYRSTGKIVEKAQHFIERGTGRFTKKMNSAREEGENVKFEAVKNREHQFDKIVEIVKQRRSETAVLYRDNESAVVLVDKFIRNGIPFTIKKPEMNFFEIKSVKNIISYLKLVENDRDTDALADICNCGLIYMKKKNLDYAIKKVQVDKISVYDAVDSQINYMPQKYRDRGDKFRREMAIIGSDKSPLDAIGRIIDSEYGKQIEDSEVDIGRVNLLRMIARNESTISDFLKRLELIDKTMKSSSNTNKDNPVILSTIHSSKGQEYESVWLIDVFDGRFPQSFNQMTNRSKDEMNQEQEERRLFYVGMTRAKDFLGMIRIVNKKSSFLEEIGCCRQ